MRVGIHEGARGEKPSLSPAEIPRRECSCSLCEFPVNSGAKPSVPVGTLSCTSQRRTIEAEREQPLKVTPAWPQELCDRQAELTQDQILRGV